MNVETTNNIMIKKGSWDEIGGMKSRVEEIRRKVEYPLKHASIYRHFGVEPVKGILLYGPPGCGKTMIARAILSTIHEYQEDQSFEPMIIYYKAGDLLDRYVGGTESNIREAFNSARRYFRRTGERAVMFLDEADGMLGRRKSGDASTSSSIPSFLAEMDGLEEGNPLVILATNKPESLDPAILRPGRIDMQVLIDRPSLEDAREIMEMHMKKTRVKGNLKKVATEVCDLMYSMEKTRHVISGAFIANVVRQATEKAIARCIKNGKTSDITLEELKEAAVELVNEAVMPVDSEKDEEKKKLELFEKLISGI